VQVLRHGAINEQMEKAMQNKLKVLRAERNWSQADLAECLGVSRQTVNALETGKYDPSLPLTFKIAHVFQLPIEEIFHYDPELDGRKI
jgi:putative transcriptional regulator